MQYNFGLGVSDDLVASEQIQKGCADYFLNGDSKAHLRYGPVPDAEDQRVALAAFLAKQYKTDVDPNSLFFTSGVSMALSFICQRLLRPGDVVYVEEPTYHLALPVFKEAGAVLVSIPVDGEGMDVEFLAAMALKTPPKAVYTIPVHHNPTGATLSDARRRRLVELSRQHHFVVIADEVYQTLTFDGPATPLPLCYYDEGENVLSLGSFAKILAPSLRLGWIQARPSFLARLCDWGVLHSGGGMNPLMASMVLAILNHNGGSTFDEHHVALKERLSARCNALCSQLKANLPSSVTFTTPKGGYFVWITLPFGLTAAGVKELAVAKGIAYTDGAHNSISGKTANCIRLSFAGMATVERLGEGGLALSRVLSDAVEAQAKLAQPSAGVATKTIKLAVHGATGRLGSLIVAEALKNLTNAGELPITYIGPIGRGDAPVPECDVVVDVSSPIGLRALIPRLTHKQALVTGSTGELPMSELSAYATRAPVAISANFGLGVPLLIDICSYIKARIPTHWSVSMVEAHHTAKLDAPSGTAKRIMERLPAGLDTPAHSLRVGDTIGEHTVWLAGPGERLELKHVATRREVFAIGALRWARWATQQAPGLYTSVP